jgi:hypothetical protein
MRRTVLALVAVAGLASCTNLRSAEPIPEDQFGHRADETEGGRITTVIGPEDESQVYRYADAFVDEVQVRPAPPAPGPVSVEILVKGAFPDACTDLHEVAQTRAGNLVEVILTTRRPQNALCASVLRPYRFYLLLEGDYAAGPYTLKLNGTVHPFEVHAPTPNG